MKILFINTSERTGGAAVAAGRLMKALQKAGIQTELLVRDKNTNAPDVYSINTIFLRKVINHFRFLWERLIIFLCNGFDRTTLFRVSVACTGTDISRHPSVEQADIIHLHWINQGFLSINDIRKLTTLGKPIVWTMHDMWPCTGICHHARECDRFTDSCGQCFYLNSTRNGDISSRVFSTKQQLIGNGDFSFVCCSKWLADRAHKSAITKDSCILSIPNPIDTTVFSPMDAMTARQQLQLPRDKHLLLFGALNVTDKQKGIDYLIRGLNQLKIMVPELYQRIDLVVFGQVKTEIEGLFDIPIHSMGYLKDEQQIAILYNAVDMFVTSSLEENLPNTIMESMACGTPCVGFSIGGIPEMIDHKKNGYVARYKDEEDLASGIEWVINHKVTHSLSINARRKVEENFNDELIADKYIELYYKISDKS